MRLLLLVLGSALLSRWLSPIDQSVTSFCPQSNLIWSDDFSGSSLDLSKWTITLGNNGGQLRNAWGTADNVWVSNGTLVLRSKRESAPQHFNFTSGAVTSKGKASWSRAPGVVTRACVSAILPGGGRDAAGNGVGKGIWPAHWMMPDDDSCWPDHGEQDIMEMINGDGFSHGTYHWNGGYPGKSAPSTTIPPLAH